MAVVIDLLIALFIYDYILSFSLEVKCIWQRRFSKVTALYVLNRYAVMSNRIVLLIELKSWRGVDVKHADHVSAAAFCSARFTDTVMLQLQVTPLSTSEYTLIVKFQLPYRVVMEPSRDVPDVPFHCGCVSRFQPISMTY